MRNNPKRKEKINCEMCGNTTYKYKLNSGYKKEKRFCSHKCYWQWRKTQKHEDCNVWKGDKVGYMGIHAWLRREFGNANRCEMKDCWGESKTYQWANLSGTYKRDRKDFKMMCASCHLRFDYKNHGKRRKRNK